MDDRKIGVALIVIGLPIAALGGTMKTLVEAFFYAGGFLMAFVGLGLIAKFYRKTTKEKET